MGRLYRGQPVFSRGDWLPVISRLPDREAVALTFDDGPTPETTPHILRTLRQHHAPATFFLSGERAAAEPDLVQAIVDDGHDIYAHGWSHLRLRDHDAATLRDEMDRCEELLARYRPTPSPYLVRLPYASGIREAQIHRSISSWMPDAQLAAWTYATPDDRIALEEPDAEAVVRRCGREVRRMMERRRLGGSILLMHEKGYDVASPFSGRTVSLLLDNLLPSLLSDGLRVEHLRPLAKVSPLSRYMMSVSI